MFARPCSLSHIYAFMCACLYSQYHIIFAFMCARLCSILVLAHIGKLQPHTWKEGVPSPLAWVPAQNARLTSA